MPEHIQEAPYCIQVEFTEGCNLYCPFCGLTGIREKGERNFKFMTVETATAIATQIKEAGWNCRIEFAMHGEPTMNPNHVELVQTFRDILPRHHMMMTSNGGGLLKGDAVKNIQALFDAGLQVLAIDEYEYMTIFKTLRKALSKHSMWGDPNQLDGDMIDGGIEIFEYPDNKVGNPHYRRKKNERHLCLVRDISVATKGTHATLNNHCGNGAPLDTNPATNKHLNAKCAKPFREITTRWDGSVPFCCNDWQGVLVPGNVHETTLQEVWQHEIFNAGRRHLYHGSRTFPPCYGCNAKSERVGLLPDKHGKVSLPEPTQEDVDLLMSAAEVGLVSPLAPPLTDKAKKTHGENSDVIMSWQLGDY